MFSLCLQFSNTALSQSTYQFGGLPSLNLNNKLKNDWSLNFKIESRQMLQKGTYNGNIDKGFEYILTDFSFITTKKVGLNSRISGGYLIRFRDGEVIHRSIQQFAIIQKMPNFRLAHRVVTDQTFSSAEATEFRLRYRLTAEIPLNGQSVDLKEFYLKINNEYLNSVQDSEYDLEIRLVPLLGYAIKDNHKIEFGLDYRVNSFLNNTARHSFWMSLNWFIDI